MTSSTFAFFGLLVARSAIIACSEWQSYKMPEIPRLGGWQKHNVSDDAIYEELAHFAVSKQVENRQFYDTVLELVDVEIQVVQGLNYRIKFKTAESTCRVTDTYSKDLCLPKSREVVKDTCTAVIYDVSWLNRRSVSSFTCEGNAVST
ncbi:cystatin-2-like [Dermacentor albipictus]|uniref:cystatin-2-like n=1 Tax=Dermacentor albipictus TaxID=60249 RepID=UPI0038FC27D1